MKINKRPSLPFSYILVYSAIYLAMSNSPPDMTGICHLFFPKLPCYEGGLIPPMVTKEEEELLRKKRAGNKARKRSLTHL